MALVVNTFEGRVCELGECRLAMNPKGPHWDRVDLGGCRLLE